MTLSTESHPRIVEANSEREARRGFGSRVVSVREIGSSEGPTWLRGVIAGARLAGQGLRVTRRGIRTVWRWWRNNDAKP
ncbi:hypothetical protein ACIA5G_28120 [Amycolatopsis sp. NPDC051758]|uniref:hypothetical protein n=1 Tax=Amycolatopsis sp. NPDC051758 TaxID=3363935 RepID=UPI0037A742F1